MRIGRLKRHFGRVRERQLWFLEADLVVLVNGKCGRGPAGIAMMTSWMVAMAILHAVQVGKIVQ